jgi:hypothetical protein
VERDKVQKMVAALPEQVDVDALVERLYLLNKIEIAEKQLSRGEGVSHEDAKKRLQPWPPCTSFW